MTLLRDNPGSTAIFSSCVAIGAHLYHGPDDTEAAAGAFASCAALGCIAADSYGNCLSVNVQLFAIAIKIAGAHNRLAAYGCDQ